MIDPELQTQLELIRKNLEDIKNNVSRPSRWKVFVQGIWHGVGYLIGLILAIALVGWILNLIGVIPFLKNIANELNMILDNFRTR
jgi:tetrahydromethanopterin S-methyltransferase subunit A